MSFLAPLFFLGALGIVGPIVFHLIQKTTREVTPFSTLMFLQPSPPRITKRIRLENFWLLLLRCIALVLLAAAFSRPFVRESSRTALPPPGEGRRLVLLLDTSASMRREKLWPEAMAKVKSRVREAKPEDLVAVIAFDRTPRVLLGFEEWRKSRPEERVALAEQRLSTLSPGYAATRIDTALLRAAELLDQPETNDAPAHREIVLVSDLQEGAHLDALQGFSWPPGISVTLDSVAAANHENAGIAWQPEAEDGAAVSVETAPIRLRVTNAPESRKEQFSLRWLGGAAPSAEFAAYVPTGKSRIIRAPKPPAGADRVVLTGDGADFDNTTFILPPQPEQVPILFLGTDADEDPAGLLYYVRRAFPSTSRETVQIIPHRTPEAVPAFQLQQAQLIIVGDGASDAAVASASEAVKGGRIALVPLSAAGAAHTVANLLGLSALGASEAAVRDYAMLSQIDFQHPLFAPFADPRFSDFSKIHFWHHRQMDFSAVAGARMLASFDNGSPALVQVPLERGSVIVLTTTWRPADSQLALSSKFLPLLHSLLDQSGQRPPAHAQYFVGDEVLLPSGSAPLTVRKPDGTDVAVNKEDPFTQTDLPGIYQVTPGTQRFVVNLAPEESRTTALTPDRLSALGVPLSRNTLSPVEAAKRDARTQATELENRQKLWRWGIVACLCFVLLETAVASRLSRNPAPASAAG